MLALPGALVTEQPAALGTRLARQRSGASRHAPPPKIPARLRREIRT